MTARRKAAAAARCDDTDVRAMTVWPGQKGTFGVEEVPHPDLHVVLTGRGAPAAVREFADMVSEIQAVKHHYKAGVQAQQAITFFASRCFHGYTGTGRDYFGDHGRVNYRMIRLVGIILNLIFYGEDTCLRTGFIEHATGFIGEAQIGQILN